MAYLIIIFIIITNANDKKATWGIDRKNAVFIVLNIKSGHILMFTKILTSKNPPHLN